MLAEYSVVPVFTEDGGILVIHDSENTTGAHVVAAIGESRGIEVYLVRIWPARK
jgi:hypothetical protein